MQNPGRSRREALIHPCQGRHRPRPWLAEMQEWTCNTMHLWWSEAIPVQAARRDNKATSFSSSMSVNRACTFPRTRLSPSPGYWLTQLPGQHQHIPLSFSVFSQVPLAHFPPDRTGFTCVTTSLSLLSVPLRRSAQAITAIRWVLLSLRHHAGMTPCLDDPAFSAETRCGVLQVFRSSLFPPSERGSARRVG
jgi:hypothetical protein